MISLRKRPEIPYPGEDFSSHEDRLRRLARDIRSGEIPERSLLGLVNFNRRPINSPILVKTLGEFVEIMTAAQETLARQKNAWDDFHAQMHFRFRELFEEREERLRQLERKRTSLAAVGMSQNDGILLDRTASLQARIEKSCEKFAVGIVAFVRSVARSREALSAWSALHDDRGELLDRLLERRSAYADMLALEHEIKDVEEDEGEPPDDALKNFDGLASQVLDPLIEKLAKVREIEESLEVLARELESLTGILDGEGESAFSPTRDVEIAAQRVLAANHFDPAALLLEATGERPVAAEGESPLPPLDQRLRVLATLLAHVTDEALGEPAMLRRLRKEGSVYGWRGYLQRYPDGGAAAEAREAIAQLDGRALARAESEATRHAWWSYLRDFPDGAGAERARQELSKTPPAAADEKLPRLAAPSTSGIFAGELAPVSCQVGWGTMRVNEGGKVEVLGKSCDRFLFPHAAASIVYAIPEKAVRFSAIGTRIAAQEAEHGTWSYEVLVDGSSVFRSPALHEQPEGIPIEVAFPPGAREMTILIDDFDDGHYDWSVLAYPYFHSS